MWEVYILSKDSIVDKDLGSVTLPLFFSDMVNRLSPGAYFRIISLFIDKPLKVVIKIDSLDLISIFMNGMILNSILSFHSFVREMADVRRN